MGKQIWVKLPIIKFPIYCMYSKTPLIWLTQDWTGAELSNIPDYQTVPVLTYVLTGTFLLLLLYFGCTTDQIWISPSPTGSGSSSVFWCLQNSKCWWKARGQKIPQRWMYRHSWRPFWTCSRYLSVSVTKLFSGEKRTSSLETLLSARLSGFPNYSTSD